MRLSLPITLCFTLSLVAGAVAAQERSATGSLDTQATWSALAGGISSVKNKTTGIQQSIAQVTACSDKGMLYAPGLPVSDTNGCEAVAGKTTLTGCYDRATPFGVQDNCNDGEVITKVCSSGADANCTAPIGAIYSGGQTAINGWQGPTTPTTLTKTQSAYTVITCCKMQ